MHLAWLAERRQSTTKPRAQGSPHRDPAAYRVVDVVFGAEIIVPPRGNMCRRGRVTPWTSGRVSPCCPGSPVGREDTDTCLVVADVPVLEAPAELEALMGAFM